VPHARPDRHGDEHGIVLCHHRARSRPPRERAAGRALHDRPPAARARLLARGGLRHLERRGRSAGERGRRRAELDRLGPAAGVDLPVAPTAAGRPPRFQTWICARSAGAITCVSAPRAASDARTAASLASIASSFWLGSWWTRYRERTCARQASSATWLVDEC